MHSLMFEVISEKYNIPYNEIMDALHQDPRIQKIIVEPTIHSLNYFSQEDIDSIQKPKDNTIECVDELSAQLDSVPEEPKKTRRILKKPVVILETATEPTPQKKKIIRK